LTDAVLGITQSVAKEIIEPINGAAMRSVIRKSFSFDMPFIHSRLIMAGRAIKSQLSVLPSFNEGDTLRKNATQPAARLKFSGRTDCIGVGNNEFNVRDVYINTLWRPVNKNSLPGQSN